MLLCLHGKRQNAEIYSQRLHRLGKRLPALQLLTVEAPHELPKDPGDSVAMRTWWGADGSGWIDSLRAIDAQITAAKAENQRQIVGILGFSQGGALAVLLCALVDHALAANVTNVPPELLQSLQSHLSALSFLIVAGAPMHFFPPDAPFCSTARTLQLPVKLRIPSLHAFSSADPVVPPQQSQALAACFDSPQLLAHDKGHVVPSRAHELALLQQFIEQHTPALGAFAAAEKAAPSAAAAACKPPASTFREMTDRQKDELAALQDIFGADVEVETLSPPTIRLTLNRGAAVNGEPPMLLVILNENYPDTAPQLSVGNISNAHRTDMLEALDACVQENLGMEMMYQLAEAANEFIAKLPPAAEMEEEEDNNTNSTVDAGASGMAGAEEPEGFDHMPLIIAATQDAAEADSRAEPFSDPRSGVWKYVVGLVGKPSAGKSTFFNAITDPLRESDAARVAAYPFTTIDPNIAQGHFRIADPLRRVGLAPAEAHELDKKVPIIVKDVAGLVPGAYQGRGKGNAFLNDLCDADVLIHVIDASGCSDKDGQVLADASGDPAEDVAWVRYEVHQWIYGNVRAKWTAVCRRPEKLAAMFTGYQAPGAMVGEALSRMGIDPSNMQLLREHLRRWTPADLHRLVAHFLRVRFPMLLALNKVDVNDRHIERLKATFPHDTCVPMSARAEWSLCQWRRRGLVEYNSVTGACELTASAQSLPPTDLAALQKSTQQLQTMLSTRPCLRNTTGVIHAVNAAVGLRRPLLVFPLADLDSLTPLQLDPHGTRPEEAACLLMRPGATADEVFQALKTLKALSGDYVRAECWDCSSSVRSKRPLRKVEPITDATRLCCIMTNRKNRWQQQQQGPQAESGGDK